MKKLLIIPFIILISGVVCGTFTMGIFLYLLNTI